MKIDIKQLRDGDLVLFHSNGFQPMGWAIRTLTKSYWNHAGIYSAGFVIEARKTVEKNSINKYLSKLFVLGIFRVKQSAYASVKEWIAGVNNACVRAEGHVGTKYDKRAIVWLGVKYLSRGFLGRLLPQRFNPWQNREEFFCSELVCACYYKTSSLVRNLFAGLKYPKAKCGTITPGDIGKRSKFVMGTNKT